jgi:hypothetical protein
VALKSLVLAVASIVLVAPGAGAGSTDDPAAPERTREPVRLMFMGDSLADESRLYFHALVTDSGEITVNDRLIFGGTAICDWLPQLKSAVKLFRPDVAVAEFTGNYNSDCMRNPRTGLPFEGKGLRDKYFRDANKAMRIFDRYDVTVYWVSTPPSCPGQVMSMDIVWRRVVRKWESAKLIDASQVVTKKGQCTEFLPCLKGEPCTATDPSTGEPAAIVRAPDGTHFCPGGPAAVQGVTGACSVWASGAWRFARAIAAPIVGDVLGGGGTAPPPLPSPADVLSKPSVVP